MKFLLLSAFLLLAVLLIHTLVSPETSNKGTSPNENPLTVAKFLDKVHDEETEHKEDFHTKQDNQAQNKVITSSSKAHHAIDQRTTQEPNNAKECYAPYCEPCKMMLTLLRNNIDGFVKASNVSNSMCRHVLKTNNDCNVIFKIINFYLQNADNNIICTRFMFCNPDKMIDWYDAKARTKFPIKSPEMKMWHTINQHGSIWNTEIHIKVTEALNNFFAVYKNFYKIEEDSDEQFQRFRVFAMSIDRASRHWYRIGMP